MKRFIEEVKQGVCDSSLKSSYIEILKSLPLFADDFSDYMARVHTLVGDAQSVEVILEFLKSDAFKGYHLGSETERDFWGVCVDTIGFLQAYHSKVYAKDAIAEIRGNIYPLWTDYFKGVDFPTISWQMIFLMELPFYVMVYMNPEVKNRYKLFYDIDKTKLYFETGEEKYCACIIHNKVFVVHQKTGLVEWQGVQRLHFEKGEKILRVYKKKDIISTKILAEGSRGSVGVLYEYNDLGFISNCIRVHLDSNYSGYLQIQLGTNKSENSGVNSQNTKLFVHQLNYLLFGKGATVEVLKFTLKGFGNRVFGIDHINANKECNYMRNLRVVTHSDNNAFKKRGYLEKREGFKELAKFYEVMKRRG